MSSAKPPISRAPEMPSVPDAPRAPIGPRLLGPIHGQRRLHELSLVLRAMDIAHGVSAQPNGFFFTVDVADGDRAARALREYDQENHEWPPRRNVAERLPFAQSLTAPIAMLALVVFAWVTGPSSSGSPWFAEGVADDVRIVHGEVWRAVTALTLHADAGHILGNAVAGTLFLGAAARRLGPGRAIFATLAAGILGNVMNAWGHVLAHAPHRSIGASTAVFAAVGILGATQLSRTHEIGARRWTDWFAPVVGALALLGMLGASPQADVWAHGAGMLAGAVIGGLFAITRRWRANHGGRERMWLQPLYALVSVGVVVGSWGLAITRG